MMAACVRTWILKLCVFTEIFLLITAQTEHMTNVAVNKPCSISSLYVENNLSNDCSAAINGNTNTTFVTEKTSPNCINTDEYHSNPIWSVNLGQNFFVHRITIYGRETYERRMACVQILLDGRELYKFPCSVTTTVRRDILVNPPQRGRVVSITKDRASDRYLESFLNICEVQIWVCAIGWWGSDCQNQCKCGDIDNYCDPQSGTCLKTNVAVYKPCSISSQYVENGLSNDCSAAINGKTSTAFVMEKTSQNCIHTSLTDLHPTWSVDLGQNFSVRSITIYGRENLERRMDCVQVFLDGRELYTFPCPGTTTVITDVYVNPVQRGQVVRITRNQQTGGDFSTFLNICEIQIWVCSKGWWGRDCQNQCSCQGKDYYCDPDNGKCSKECSKGYWGDNCSNICGRGCKNGACNLDNGTCDCKSGWAAPSCDVCSDGHYNPSNDCHNTCSKGCHNTCSRTDGTCQCQTRWKPPLCQVCSIGWWGSDCQNQCSCQGKDYYCDPDNGKCSKVHVTTVCSSGYWGENCTVCGAGCSNTCDDKSGACRCTNGWTGPQCTDCSHGHYNMSNDCQNTCGRGCHDTCSGTDGTCQCWPGWQPPLCQQCSAGHYNISNDCQNTCGEGCHDTCNRTDGTCQCQTGWQPPQCQRKNTSDCSAGHYNVSHDCQNTCGEGCHDTCSRTDGTCQCQTGWQPPLCQFMTSSRDDKEALIGVSPVAGIAVSCAIVFFILGFLTRLRLRLSRCHQPSATHGSPVKTSVTSDLGTSSTTTHPAEPRGTTSSEDTADHSNNVYDELKALNDDNKSAYTSLRFQNKGKESAAPSDYINTRKILMNE
ncbi:multiple epidermal growth factor-like domains protein 10 [Pomacea canaliculata]|uniref:multiple epidermal growth factor-like domains protein 10 n=1 Tax=Pomacea canaliculata TaxID=400727 RepID=UPI000D73EC90|nr:multiple epidermal growth factor-like domains protein 10 [Pomacea canaliculata]